eukprot:CAMPEP_0202401730 /NCGR_PEP_ID=MMETSP1128-20130828/3699_1 /ASSEMBLY_ACC=CAM_ASM_000463 /TAXON_ID=3047 /ORGANISM="Dunaliella tertiolecta, Strain CCMP1320" /LENGTH=368 /DNA_ID=CAMNT_0049005595 /DNA_START=54 /DNA_END=1163 /DNA_ORIENTATION=+
MNSGRGTLHAFGDVDEGALSLFRDSPPRDNLPQSSLAPAPATVQPVASAGVSSATVAQHASEGNDMGSEGSSSSEGEQPAKKPKNLPMSFVPLSELGNFWGVGPSMPQWLVRAMTWATGKEQLVKAHRADPINSHIGTKSREGKAAASAAAGPSAPKLPQRKPKPNNPHQQNKARWEQHLQQQQEAPAEQGSIRIQLQAAGMEQMRFGHTLFPLMADRILEPPLNGPLLMEQADAAYKILGETQLAGRQTAAFWASLTCNVDLREQLSVWLALASIASVQVSGSLEEERLFSKLAQGFIKDEQRNPLEAEHLNVCLVLATQRIFTFAQCPFISAMRKWFAARERRLAAVPRQPHQPRQPVVIEIDSDG